MAIHFKKLFFNITFNTCLFIMLVIGIQNSSKKISINLLINETVKLPVSFFVGASFISGSIIGGVLPTIFCKEKK